MKLSDLEVGDVATVKKIEIPNKKRRRQLMIMGLTKGVEVKVKEKAPLGDPIKIGLRGFDLCVSNVDTVNIEVTPCREKEEKGEER